MCIKVLEILDKGLDLCATLEPDAFDTFLIILQFWRKKIEEKKLHPCSTIIWGSDTVGGEGEELLYLYLQFSKGN